MQPIKEYGGARYFFRMYDKDGERPHVARRLGNIASGDGALFHGRGFVQLTGRVNYADWQNRLGVDLTSGPAAADQVLDLDVATQILFEGMILGTFTGKKILRLPAWSSRRLGRHPADHQWTGQESADRGICAVLLRSNLLHSGRAWGRAHTPLPQFYQPSRSTQPPSTSTVVPVTKSFSTRYIIAWAHSAAVPARGMRLPAVMLA